MSCCISLYSYLKKKLDFISYEFDEFLNKILEIKSNSVSKDYNLINLDEIIENKKNDHVVIDVPISQDYDII